MLFQEEFREIARRCGRFRLVNVLSDDELEGCEKGFISAELIRKHAPVDGDYSVFVCGPQAMNDFVDAEIAELGLRPKFVRHELLGEYRNPGRNADYPEGARGRRFKLGRLGLRRVLFDRLLRRRDPAARDGAERYRSPVGMQERGVRLVPLAAGERHGVRARGRGRKTPGRPPVRLRASLLLVPDQRLGYRRSAM